MKHWLMIMIRELRELAPWMLRRDRPPYRGPHRWMRLIPWAAASFMLALLLLLTPTFVHVASCQATTAPAQRDCMEEWRAASQQAWEYYDNCVYDTSPAVHGWSNWGSDLFQRQGCRVMFVGRAAAGAGQYAACAALRR